MATMWASPEDSATVRAYLIELQQRMCSELESLEPSCHFDADDLDYPNGGRSQVRVIANGDTWEKGGINFSHVKGDKLPSVATERNPQLAGASFEAMGVSGVMHPRNPYAPTSHVNVRFFLATKEDGSSLGWFGGGFDLTPYYGFVEDCQHWHRTAAEACASFGDQLYPELKAWCDRYFYLPHRQEARGIGGLFFDDWNAQSFEECFSLMRSVGDHFIPAYLPIVARRKDTVYGETERSFQTYRRGRYAEFNLLYDRGTAFGIKFGGRTEAILMSMPPIAEWRYDWHPSPGSAEEKLYTDFLPARDWLID